MSSENNLTNQKLGLGYLSSVFDNASIDNRPHPNSRISNFKFDIINLGTLRNVVPTAVLRQNLYSDIIFSRRKQWGFENIIIKNDEKIYEVISELPIYLYGDYSYFAPYKVRFETLNTNFFKTRLQTRATIIKDVDKTLPYTRLQFPQNLSNTTTLSGSRITYAPSIVGNIATPSFVITGYNSGINYFNRNTFLYRNFSGACGYIPYPNTVAIWQYPSFNINTKIALDSVYPYADMYNDMQGLLVGTLRSPNGSERVVYISPHGVKNKFFNVIIDNIRLQPSRIQPKVIGQPPRLEYAQINSGITVNVLDIDSEYYVSNSLKPTPWANWNGMPNVFRSGSPRNIFFDRVQDYWATLFNRRGPSTASGGNLPNTPQSLGYAESPKYTEIDNKQVATNFDIINIISTGRNVPFGSYVYHGLPITSQSGVPTGWERISLIGSQGSTTSPSWNSFYIYSGGPILTNLLNTRYEADLCYFQINPNRVPLYPNAIPDSRIEIKNPELGVKISVTGNWGGYRAVWQASYDGINWQNFQLEAFYNEFIGFSYNGDRLFEYRPKGLMTENGASGNNGDLVRGAYYTGFLPSGLNGVAKYLRVINPPNNLVPYASPQVSAMVQGGGGINGGGTILVSVSSAIDHGIFKPGLVLNSSFSTGDLNFSVQNHLQQDTPLRDTWYYKFYSGLYTSNKTLSTGTWNGIIPSGHSITLEYIVTKDVRMGTNNEFRFVYENYGDNSFIDQSIRNTFKNPIIVETGRNAWLTPSIGTVITDPLTGRSFTVGNTVSDDVASITAYNRAVESWKSANNSNYVLAQPILKRSFGLSSDIRDAVSISNNLLRKNVNNIYNQYRKLLPSGISIHPENSKVRRFRNLYTTNIYDYVSIEDIPSGAVGCFKLANKQIICQEAPTCNISSSSSIFGWSPSGSHSFILFAVNPTNCGPESSPIRVYMTGVQHANSLDQIGNVLRTDGTSNFPWDFPGRLLSDQFYRDVSETRKRIFVRNGVILNTGLCNFPFPSSSSSSSSRLLSSSSSSILISSSSSSRISSSSSSSRSSSSSNPSFSSSSSSSSSFLNMTGVNWVPIDHIFPNFIAYGLSQPVQHPCQAVTFQFSRTLSPWNTLGSDTNACDPVSPAWGWRARNYGWVEFGQSPLVGGNTGVLYVRGIVNVPSGIAFTGTPVGIRLGITGCEPDALTCGSGTCVQNPIFSGLSNPSAQKTWPPSIGSYNFSTKICTPGSSSSSSSSSSNPAVSSSSSSRFSSTSVSSSSSFSSGT